MKTVKTWNGEVQAYQDADLAKLYSVFINAEQAWYNEWRNQGSKDEGSCTGGKGFKVPYLAPRKRTVEYRRVVPCNWVQGNVSAQKAKHAAEAILAAAGVKFSYDDGWLD